LFNNNNNNNNNDKPLENVWEHNKKTKEKKMKKGLIITCNAKQSM
jgi:hypothetical protein